MHIHSLSACLLVTSAVTANAETLPPGVMRINSTPAPALRLDNLDGEAYDHAVPR
ncbi:MAG: hypothetical protein ABFS24_00845 [Pseudomonadota bacterium]